MPVPEFDEATRTELEAAAFRRLVQHLRERTDVQNIDLMNLAGFCRNCLSRWYREAAEQKGIALADPEAPRDRLRDALQGVAGAVSARGDAGAESRVGQGQHESLTAPGIGRYPARLLPERLLPWPWTLPRKSSRNEARPMRRNSAVSPRTGCGASSSGSSGSRRSGRRSATTSRTSTPRPNPRIRRESDAPAYPLRKQEPAEIEEQESLLDVYRRALGM